MAAVGRRDSFLNNTIPLCVFLLIIMMSASTSKAITNVLTSGQTLGWKEKLGYPNSKVSLSWNPFCNLVLRDDEGDVQWKSKTGGFRYFGCTLSLNDTGSLVLTGYFGDQVWRSDNAISAVGKYVAVLHPEARVVIYSPAIWTVGVLTEKESSMGISSNNDINNNEMVSSMTNLKNTPAIHNALFSSDRLYNGNNISENGYTFILDDCDLFFKDSHGGIFWQTFNNVPGKKCYAGLDLFGVLAIFDDQSQNLVWSNKKQLAHPTSFGEYALVIESGGTASIYGPDVWSKPHRLYRGVIPRDGHIKMPTDNM